MSDFLTVIENSIEFADPGYLIVLPIAGLLFLFGLATFVLLRFFRPVRTYGSSYPFLGHVKFWFFTIIVLAIVTVAAARPYLVTGARSFKRGNVDVVVIIDGSASMWVKDLGSSRLELAIREISNLYVDGILTNGDRVALFVFGTTAVRKVHLSSDAERFIEQVNRVAPPETLYGDAFPWDSDITSALEHLYQSLDNQDRFESGEEDWFPNQRSDRLVLLFTDGDYLTDNPEQILRLDIALSEFRQRGLVVYPVGIGSRTGLDLDVVLQDYKLGIDYDPLLAADLAGIHTRLENESILMFEQRTGGRSFILDSAEISSTMFLRNAIDSHRGISFQVVPSDEQQELWQIALVFAVFFLVLAVLFY